MLLVHVTTVPETFNFFRGQIAYMKAQGFEIHGIASPGELLNTVANREKISVHPINMTRKITPFKDLFALSRLFLLFHKMQPTIVHAHTPKGGLLGVLAARMARVPIIIYTMRGLPFVTATGLRRRLLTFSEKATCLLADNIISVSHSIRMKSLSIGLCQEDKIRVLGSGSSNGVDAEVRFNPKRISAREEIRSTYQIGKEALVLGFVGRIVRDKGIVELEEAWQLLKDRFSKLFLLLIGPIESQDSVPPEILKRLKEDPHVIFIGMVNNVAPYYSTMDILVLPTYREGFPNTPLEAAAMTLPVVATQVDGCVDAVIDGVTGILVPPRDSKALVEAVEKLIKNSEMRKKMGQAGRQRVMNEFRPQIIWEALYQNYIQLLNSKGIPFQN